MKRIETTLSEIEYFLWQNFCQNTHKTSTQNLRQFIQNSISQIQNNSNITASSPPIKSLKNNKITIRFTQSEWEAIMNKVTLEGYKNPTHWLRSLVMNVLYQEAVLTDTEILAAYPYANTKYSDPQMQETFINKVIADIAHKRINGQSIQKNMPTKLTKENDDMYQSIDKIKNKNKEHDYEI